MNDTYQRINARLAELRKLREDLERRVALEHAALSGAIQELEEVLTWLVEEEEN